MFADEARNRGKEFMLTHTRFMVSTISALILIFTVPAAAQQAAPPPPKPATPPAGGTTEPGARWVLEQPVHEFGTAWAGMIITHPFIIRNVGNEPLIIHEAKPKCACSISENYTREIPPGGEGQIPFTLNTAGKFGKVSETISVRTNDKVQPWLTLEMRGEAKSVVRMEVIDDGVVRPGTTEFGEIRYADGNFGRIKSDQHLRRVIRMENTSGLDLKLRVLGVNQATERFKAVLKETKPNQFYELTITGIPPFPEGYTEGKITFTTGLAESPDFTVGAYAYVPPRIEVMPPKVIVDPKYPIQPIRALRVTNNGSKHFELTSISCSNPDFKLKLLPPNPTKPDTREIKVTLPLGKYRPPPYGDVIRIETSDSERPVIDVLVLPEVGVEAAARPDDAPLLFHPGEMN